MAISQSQPPGLYPQNPPKTTQLQAHPFKLLKMSKFLCINVHTIQTQYFWLLQYGAVIVGH